MQLEQATLNRDVLIENNIRDNETKILMKQLEMQIKSLESQNDEGDGIVERDPMEKEKINGRFKKVPRRIIF